MNIVQDVQVIPKPNSIQFEEGSFVVHTNTEIWIPNNNSALQSIANDFNQFLKQQFGFTLNIVETQKNNQIQFQLLESNLLDQQGKYEIHITQDFVQIKSNHESGLFYGIQTLKQILSSQYNQTNDIELPCVCIIDQPQFRWRGLLLDCCRHMMSLDFIKRYIDLLAYHKMNVLHLHLTEDQGWRIEIEKYPKLNDVGSYRVEEGKRYGGYYTKKELKEIVQYAQSRFIEVIPEFDIPGHTTAAIASYPELSCTGKQIEVLAEWGIFENVLCPGKENTFEFIEGVLEEMLDIFPSPYIHIGGDESPRTHWKDCPHCQVRMKSENLQSEDELQGYLNKRVASFLKKHGRRMIGWDEVLTGGEFPNDAIVQSWQGMEGAVEALKRTHEVISSPLQFVYFDYPNDEEHAKSKPDWMKVTPIEKVYSFQPIPDGLSPEQAEKVLGSECTMWTEYAPQEVVDQQLFPRLCAFSETVWTNQTIRDGDDFARRLEVHLSRLKDLGVEFYRNT